MSTEQLITSFLDTDLYKITMHAAIYDNFPHDTVTFKYTNRTSTLKKLNLEAINWLKTQIYQLANLRFTKEEIKYLQKEVPFLPSTYLKFIETFKLDPKTQITFANDEDVSKLQDFEITISGKWVDTTLYEIPILALVSESYFKFVDTNWSNDGQVEQASLKAQRLIKNGCAFSEFGTRRRRSLKSHELVMSGLVDGAKKSGHSELLLGTSNVYFAKQFGLKPIGTVGHEWMMGIAAITQDYVNANKKAMDCWLKTMGYEHAGLALTDTFGTDAFLKVFHEPYSKYYIVA
ncbi:unnamed protein product [Ambrosiozyma monospora]|uniref:Nicotinate phosphoribosyltransferase n=1 Tax=Ambrosiozyma monospora TaxID=43982 RepID=A0A9W6Z0R8_AMBMO|nr:unnamed protein product [Ambrosiozyma monospora]